MAVEYDNVDGDPEFYYVEHLSSIVEPHSSFTLNNSSALSHSEPALLVAGVIGARFEGGTSWGDLPAFVAPPPPPPPPPPLPASAEAAAQDQPGATTIRKSGGVLQTSALKRVQPSYPPLAVAAQVSGVVVVEVLIDEEGNVSFARAVSGHPLLKGAAVEAATQWKFSPTTLDGNPVRVIGTITMNFTL